jgi:hypothetical protein
LIRPRLKKLLLIAAPAAVVAAVAAMLAIEVWVRLSWDEARGQPGFFLTDAARGQRLAPNYDGWFAGVPVRINALGFRDWRNYTLEKPKNTIRILVLGDSVTFGHGTLKVTTRARSGPISTRSGPAPIRTSWWWASIPTT